MNSVTNKFIVLISLILVEFPKWWIFKLPFMIFEIIKNSFSDNFRKFGIKFLIKNILRPLFGFKSKVDHVLSILVRIGHLIIISVIAFLYSILKIIGVLILYISPFLSITEIIGLTNFIDVPNLLYILVLVFNLALYFSFRNKSETKSLKNKYKSSNQNFGIVIKSIDKNCSIFLNKINPHLRNPLFTSRELLGWLISEKVIYDLFMKLEKIPKYTQLTQDNSDEKISMKKILNNSFVKAYDLNLSNISLLEIFSSTIEHTGAKKLLDEYNIGVDEISKIIDFHYKEINIRKILEDNQKKARLRSTYSTNRGMTSKLSPLVDSFTTDLTKQALSFADDNFQGREKEFEYLVELLKNNKSPIITGKSGVGKTALIRYLALKMATLDIPDYLQDKRLVMLNTSTLIAGDKENSSNEAGKRLVTILDEIVNAPHIILVIDEVSNLVGIKDGNNDTNFDLFSLLSQSILNKNLQVITTSTKENFERYIANDPTVYRVFQKVILEEQPKDKIFDILLSNAIKLEKKYKIHFTLPSLENAYSLSHRFIHDYSMPAKAINLIEETVLQRKNNNNKYVFHEDISKTLKHKINIDVTSLQDNEADKLINLEDEIHNSIIGQEVAVKSVSSALRRARLDIRDDDSPIAKFLFMGPTGVGKTELAKTTAKIFFGRKDSFIRIDMSEYPDKKSIYKLIGYNNDTEYIPGLLTEPIKTNPFSLILFDEIEKAHKDVLNLFLQLLDDGRLTDGKGKTIDFKNTIIIATTNVGNEYIQQSFVNNISPLELQRNLKNKILPNEFRLEFINRFSKLITFTPLSDIDVRNVTSLILNNLRTKFSKKNIVVNFDDSVITHIAENAYDPIYGARNIKNIVQDCVNDVVAKQLLLSRDSKNIEINLVPGDFSEF